MRMIDASAAAAHDDDLNHSDNDCDTYNYSDVHDKLTITSMVITIILINNLGYNTRAVFVQRIT